MSSASGPSSEVDPGPRWDPHQDTTDPLLLTFLSVSVTDSRLRGRTVRDPAASQETRSSVPEADRREESFTKEEAAPPGSWTDSDGVCGSELAPHGDTTLGLKRLVEAICRGTSARRAPRPPGG
ncbi:unnamed protein product [Pleuronectes platessa]|uniref:Uncharacterized protein n=1 Tax=Pleuronectes platessa TaxID=8262 RepID=A0A9N7Y6Z1_PLEPL|nr:unnamed protein product [Pleuronectes platessa]